MSLDADVDADVDADADAIDVDAVSTSTTSLPAAFLAWLSRNDISSAIYTLAHTLPRFIRINPRCPITLDALRTALHTDSDDSDGDARSTTSLAATPIPHVYRLDAHVKIASSAPYRAGQIYGVDLASIVAVLALAPSSSSPFERILDLCCAPGAKLCTIADLIGSAATTRTSDLNNDNTNDSANDNDDNVDRNNDDGGAGIIVGVDVSAERLQAARNVLRKYKIPAVRLFHADGQTFDVLPEQARNIPAYAIATAQPIVASTTTTTSSPSIQVVLNKRQRRAARRRAANAANLAERENKRAKMAAHNDETTADSVTRREENDGGDDHECNNDDGDNNDDNDRRGSAAAIASSPTLYDRVLVDAECTHDGSIKHIVKFHQWGWSTFEHRFLNAARLSSLQQLQRNLLANGFRLLRPGGILVYSTCSFCRAQNEEVVEWLVRNHVPGQVELLPAFDVDACAAIGVRVRFSRECGGGEDGSGTTTSAGAFLELTRAPACEGDVPAAEAEAALHCRMTFLSSSDGGDGANVSVSTASCVRFDPIVSRTSGLFVARLRKLGVAAARAAPPSSSNV